MHKHLIQVRWSDQDPYDHVNNVLYIVYADEAFRAMVADGFDLEGRVVVACATEFLRPLAFNPEPAQVATRVEGDVVVQEIFDNRHGDGHPVCRVTTTLGAARTEADTDISGGVTYDCFARRVETEADGAVGYARQFEHIQEGRALISADLLADKDAGEFVIGRTEATFHRPLVWRADPYKITSRIHKVGTKSFTIKSVTHHDGLVYTESSTVLVGFDLVTQASRELTDIERQHFDAMAR